MFIGLRCPGNFDSFSPKEAICITKGFTLKAKVNSVPVSCIMDTNSRSFCVSWRDKLYLKTSKSHGVNKAKIATTINKISISITKERGEPLTTHLFN